MAEKGRQLDLTSGGQPAESLNSASEAPISKFLGVQFACCDIYARIYINREQTAYQGHCPRCAKQVRFQVGQGGTDARFFTVY